MVIVADGSQASSGRQPPEVVESSSRKDGSGTTRLPHDHEFTEAGAYNLLGFVLAMRFSHQESVLPLKAAIDAAGQGRSEPSGLRARLLGGGCRQAALDLR
jgi:hypothetical protein